MQHPGGKAVSKVPGVTACSVSLLTNSMGVEGTASPRPCLPPWKRRATARLKGAAPAKAEGTASAGTAGDGEIPENEAAADRLPLPAAAADVRVHGARHVELAPCPLFFEG